MFKMSFSQKIPAFTLVFTALLACNTTKKTIAPAMPSVPDPVFENIKIDEAVAGEYFGPCEPSICVNLANTNNIDATSILNRQ